MGSAPMSNPSATSAAGLPGQLEEARRELRDEILRGHGGRAALALFSDRLDSILRHIVAAAPPAGQPLAVVAIGGYGRRQLSLHSDIDLLVLFGGKLGAEEEQSLRAILHPLWDLGLVDERYAMYNSTLYQLEPDVKESPGALRDLTATRWIAALTDPALLRRGVEDPLKSDEA